MDNSQVLTRKYLEEKGSEVLEGYAQKPVGSSISILKSPYK